MMWGLEISTCPDNYSLQQPSWIATPSTCRSVMIGFIFYSGLFGTSQGKWKQSSEDLVITPTSILSSLFSHIENSVYNI